MVIGSALADSLSACHASLPSSSHYAVDCIPRCSKSVFAATSFSSSPEEGKADANVAGTDKADDEEKPIFAKSGRTATDQPCQCTDPPKRKTRGVYSRLKGAIGVGELNRDHKAVIEQLRREQRAAEVRNANLLVRAPYKSYVDARKQLEKAIAAAEEDYAAVRRKADEYMQAHTDAMIAMNTHCRGLSRQYRGMQFDCEKTRALVQNQYLARRKQSECLIGEATPYDDFEDGASSKTHWFACLPPEVAVIGNLIMANPSCTAQASSPVLHLSDTSSQALLARPQQSRAGHTRRNIVEVSAFL